jgi:pantoate--beta-alanine ligase
MITYVSPDDMQAAANRARSEGRRIAVVPTMGALHRGHLALVREARSQGDVVITTIFVNPTQFGPAEDFDRYPRSLQHDSKLAEEAGTDILFAPAAEAIYPPQYQTYVTVRDVSARLEGALRPDHFRGVVTVVAKLVNLTKPHAAVFGQKDVQQVAVIRRMLRDLNFDIRLIVVPTVREPDGLALSSRNVYLSSSQRKEAPVLFASLRRAESMIRSGVRSRQAIHDAVQETIAGGSSAVIDYVSIADAETFDELEEFRSGASVVVSLAARFGSTRLIDNICITV